MINVKHIKLILLSALLVFILIIVLNFGKKEAVKPEISEAPGQIKNGQQILSESNIFEFTKTEMGEKIFRIAAEKFEGYENGVQKLSDVKLDFFGEKSGDIEITAGKAEYNPSNENVRLIGQVEMKNKSGLRLTTDEVEYSGNGKIISDSKVNFSKSNYSGCADSLSFDVNSRELNLSNNIILRSPDVILSGNRLDYSMPDEKAIITGDPEVKFKEQGTLRCGRIEAFFPGDALTRIYASGTADFLSLTGSDSLKAENLTALMDSTGKYLERITASGNTETLFRNSNSGKSYLLITDMITASFSKGMLDNIESIVPSSVQVSDNNGVPSEKASCGRFIAFYNDTDREFHRLSLSGKVTLESDSLSGRSEEAVYYRNSGNIVLRDSAEILYDNYEIKADLIRYNSSVKVLFAEKNVTAKISGSSLRELPFSGNSPVYISSGALELKEKDELAVFTVDVNARQDKDVIVCNKLELDNMAGEVRGTGRVTTRVQLEDEVVPMIINSEQLVYDQKTEIANYFPQVNMSRKGFSVSCSNVRVRMSDEIDEIEMDGELILSGENREAVAEKGIYLLSNRSLFMQSLNSLVSIRDLTSGEIVKGRNLTYFVDSDRIEIGGDPYGRTSSSSKADLKGF